MNGELTIDLQLPDKMLRTDSMNPMGDATITVEQGFNGDTLLRHSATSGGGPNMMIRMGGPNTPEAQAQMLKAQKADAARLDACDAHHVDVRRCRSRRRTSARPTRRTAARRTSSTRRVRAASRRASSSTSPATGR